MADDLGDLRKLAADLTKAGAMAGMKAALAVRKAALDVETEAKRLVIAQKAVDTGNHLNSIGADIAVTGATTTATIGPTTSYGPYLEFGKRRMAPRPHMGPALNKVAPSFEDAIASLGGGLLDE